MKATANSDDDVAKLNSFNKVCRSFKPVFHHFFLEHFQDPHEWFEKRVNYTHSVASSSMIGFIVGLGDRHLQNILIDRSSASIINIDLGIAFEQGLSLPVPETVPFRLTRDVVDGFGVTGTEGVFRRSCEEVCVCV
jgi:ataxia telangiectasia mutated family protein